MGKSTKIVRKKKKSKKRNPVVRCPYCGAVARFQSADGIYRDNSNHTMLYVCPNFPECDSYVRVHKGTKIPVGSMANQELRKLRKEAHDHFDRLYQYGYMSKQDAYQWLADIIAAPLAEAHIGHMSEYYCQLVIKKSEELFEARKKQERKQFKVIGGGHYETGCRGKEAG
ncbi:MAG: DUF3268 family zinc-finger domain-containing protein [Lachnospiraceae bacterium]|nr:DUF3268 family zinc-finger domain-containing protein [Lachnospiraceae bacterium]